MCGLCGVFGVARHWTDASGAADAGTGTAERIHRARVANRMLGLFGLSLREWAGRYTLASRTGRAAVVDNLGAVWPEAERLAGRPCDPLDPAVIAAMEARRD
ncbi:MAG: hypothetical protein KatS3mg118_1045 [Paracoccaceae bacterium]|nr:MAG: hypothetical protein D6686_13315 [Alphaproteobacteria bacterium]GIX13086.1 MAG: hypothetical protein KatS3mg118_1045 [Paracoccaceae bacterium]